MTIPEDGKGTFCAAPLSLGDAACGLRRTSRFYKPPVDFGKTKQECIRMMKKARTIDHYFHLEYLLHKMHIWMSISLKLFRLPQCNIHYIS